MLFRQFPTFIVTNVAFLLDAFTYYNLIILSDFSKQVLFAGVMLIMWVFGAPTMSASITKLDNSYFARRQGLNTLYLQIATVSVLLINGESRLYT